MTRETISQFAWEDEISGFQRFVLKISSLVGVVIFFIGVQMIVRGRAELGGWFSGIGMFIAAEMRWGIKGSFNFLERRAPGLLKRVGYPALFWVIVLVAYAINFLGLVSLIFFATDWLAGA